jgi:serine/threonine-protein kinase
MRLGVQGDQKRSSGGAGAPPPLAHESDPGRIDLQPGYVIGEYVVESKIGGGAFGAVYAGLHPIIGKRVAIKVLDHRYSSDPTMVSRFIDEARAVNKIGHTNIVDIFAFGALEDGRRYLVMELLSGRVLEQLIEEKQKLSVDEALPILGQLSEALEAAHSAGIAHRDLKPANVFLVQRSGTWSVKLLDFGVAKLFEPDGQKHATQSGIALGTPMYMSPEQCMGKGVDHRTDVYAFGVVCYRVLAGEHPFDGGSVAEVMAQHIFAAPKPLSLICPEIPEPVSEAVLWMLDKDKQKRPQTAAEAFRQLERAARGERIERAVGLDTLPDAPSSIERASKTDLPAAASKPNRLRFIGLGALLVAAAVLVLAQSMKKDAPPPAQAAQPVVETPPPVEAAKQEAKPATVRLDVRGVPERSRVLAADGRELGPAPGAIEVARSEESLELTIEAEGFEPKKTTIVPDKDQVLMVELEAKKRGAKETQGKKKRANDIEPWR